MSGYLANVPQLSDQSCRFTHQPTANPHDRRRYRSELVHVLDSIRRARARYEAQHGPLPATDWAPVTPRRGRAADR